MSLTPIQNFYRGRSVFVTGATGFCGQVLLEKLLRCTQIKTIYLLLRASPSSTVSQRLDNLLQQKLLRDCSRACGTNIVPVPGNLGLEGLGLTPEDRERLCQEVSVVFHSAATVKFNEKIQETVKINFHGSRSIVELCHDMKQIKSLVYVSTAYSQCPRHEIEEKIYPPPADMIALKKLDQQMITEREILGRWPNAYTFSKAMAEHYVGEKGEGLPVAIVRPSAVVGKCEAPLPGWVTENTSGTNVIISNASLGLQRCCHMDSRKVIDLVPVDMVANMLIAAAWHTAEQPRTSITVYNYVSGTQNPITWGEYLDHVRDAATENPPLRAGRPYLFLLTSNGTLHSLLSYLLEVLPARGKDMRLFITQRTHKFVDQLTKLHNLMQLGVFFTTRDWQFRTKNVESLLERMTLADRRMFNIDVKNINWKSFVKESYLGVREYMLKDPPCTIPEARRRIHRMKIVRWTVQSGVLLCLFGFGVWKIKN